MVACESRNCAQDRRGVVGIVIIIIIVSGREAFRSPGNRLLRVNRVFELDTDRSVICLDSFDRLKNGQLRGSSYLGLYARYSGTVFDARRHGAIMK